jgi:hypothetical protein
MTQKKVTNKSYEGTDTESTDVVALPGGKNVRLMYARGLTLNLGNYESEKIDMSYAGDFEASEVNEKLDLVKAWVHNKLQLAAKTRVKG